MTFTILSLAILAILAAILYGEIRRGYKRGLTQSALRLANLLVSAFLAAVFSVLLGTMIGNILVEIMGETIFWAEISSNIGVFSASLGIILNMLLSLVLYLPFFFGLRAAVDLALKLILRVLLKKRSKSERRAPQYLSEDEQFYVKKEKRIGAALGALSGFVLTVLIFMPITGLVKSGDLIMDTFRAQTESAAAEDAKGEQLLDRYANDFSGTVLYACGGEAVYNMTTQTWYKGHGTYLNKEIRTIGEANLLAARDRFKGAGGIRAENVPEVEATLEEFDNSLILRFLMADVVRNASVRWSDNRSYFGLEKPSFGSHTALDDFMNSILLACTTTTIDTYDADVQTILNLITIFGEYPELSSSGDYDSFVDGFVEKGGVIRVEDELRRNPHMDTVTFSVDDLILDVIAEELKQERFTDEIKSRLYANIADTLRDSSGLSGSAQSVAVSNGIAEHFEEAGLRVPESLNSELSDILIKNLIASGDQVTDVDVENLFYGRDNSTNK